MQHTPGRNAAHAETLRLPIPHADLPKWLDQVIGMINYRAMHLCRYREGEREREIEMMFFQGETWS
jgi:hypothetical protein